MTHDAQTAREHGRFLDERRQDLGLKWSEIARDMDRLFNVSVTPDYLSKIKRGTAPLSKMSVDVREALRRVLRISPAEWQTATGLYTPEAVKLAALDSAQLEFFPPPTPLRSRFQAPNTRPARRPLWPNLAAMIDQKCERYPELKQDRWQQYLNNTRFAEGREPDEDGWFEMFQSLRRNGVEPQEWDEE